MIKLMPIVEQLQQEQLDEAGVKDIALGAAMTAASIFGGSKAQAQNTPLQQLAKQPTTQTTKRVGSSVDGIVGEYTSKYLFPLKSSDTLKSISKVNGEVVSATKTGGKTSHKMTISTASDHGISMDQMLQWNDFVRWMKSKGYAGSPKMNNTSYSWNVVDEYIADINPDFFIEDSSDVSRVQSALQTERAKIIELWKTGGTGIKIGDQIMDPNNPADVAKVEEKFMPIIRPIFYK